MDTINWNDILGDIGKVSTMLGVSRLFGKESLQDPEWRKSSLYTLLGFTAYHVLTKGLFSTENIQNPTHRAIANDWIKVGTVMVISRILSGQPLNQEWLRSSLYTLLGFTAYNLFTKNLISGEKVSDTPGIQTTVNDIVKFSTMFIVSQLLSGGSLVDPAWQKASLGTLLGFAVYNLLVKGILKQY